MSNQPTPMLLTNPIQPPHFKHMFDTPMKLASYCLQEFGGNQFDGRDFYQNALYECEQLNLITRVAPNLYVVGSAANEPTHLQPQI